MSQSENDSKYRDLATECDQLIKAGKLHQVAARMALLNSAQVPRTWRQSLAKICRRATLINQGLRLLHPVIRQERLAEIPATAGEIAEYSVLLIRNGSVQEAETLLKSVDPSEAPEALMYLGFVGIAKWDYVPAAKHLKMFLQSKADDYSKLIARVNLASCHIVLSELNEATALLSEAISVAEKFGATRLIGNCYELWGQVHFWQNDFAQAREVLKKASEIFGNAQSYDQLLIHKTESIMLALEQNSTEPLIKFKAEALARRHWESVREADLFTLKVQFHQQSLDHLLCGTPLAGYRSRIQTLLGHTASESYILGKDASQEGRKEIQWKLNLQTGKVAGKPGLVAGRKIHQVLAALTRDFYAPRNIGHLFAELYPGEFFNISSSRFRVRQLIVRTRAWLKENKIPVRIEHAYGNYRLLITGDFGIQIPLETATIDLFQVRWVELRSAFAAKKFSAQQVSESLRLPRSTVRRLIDWALERELLHKTGVGKATRYEIATQIEEIPLKQSA